MVQASQRGLVCWVALAKKISCLIGWMMTILLTHEHEAVLAGLHFGVGTAKAADGPKCRSTNAQEIQSPRPMQRANGPRLGPF